MLRQIRAYDAKNAEASSRLQRFAYGVEDGELSVIV